MTAKKHAARPLTRDKALEWVATAKGAGLQDARREARRLGITEQEIRRARHEARRGR